ncbi:MAG: tellurite resistance TerB family protein [Dinoroseobacter sp.]|nr:tellurite resistance TerB family protein [Dinoroseobacter sp.]
MSFVQTLALLGAGYATARGTDWLASGGAEGIVSGAAETLEGMGAGSVNQDMLGLAGALGVAGLAGGILAATTPLGDVLSGRVDQPASQEAEAAAKLQIRAMIEAAKSDGHLSMIEKQRILASLGDASPGELAWVNAQMNAPTDPQKLASDTPEDQRTPVFRSAAMTIRRGHPVEERFLSKLGDMLGLSSDQQKALRT